MDRNLRYDNAIIELKERIFSRLEGVEFEAVKSWNASVLEERIQRARNVIEDMSQKSSIGTVFYDDFEWNQKELMSEVARMQAAVELIYLKLADSADNCREIYHGMSITDDFDGNYNAIYYIK